MTQPCTDEESNPEALAGEPVDDGWDIGIDEGDGGDYDRALDAHDRDRADG
jgi:hypothetical protein